MLTPPAAICVMAVLRKQKKTERVEMYKPIPYQNGNDYRIQNERVLLVACHFDINQF